MKQFFRQPIKKFTRWYNKRRREEKIGFIVGIILAVVFGMMCFASSDITPASKFDYEQLENVALDIEKKQDSLFDNNCEISVNENRIILTLENKECKLVKKYDKDFNVISIQKFDKSIFWLFAFVLITLISFTFGVICIVVLIGIIYLIEGTYQFIEKKFRMI